MLFSVEKYDNKIIIQTIAQFKMPLLDSSFFSESPIIFCVQIQNDFFLNYETETSQTKTTCSRHRLDDRLY